MKTADGYVVEGFRRLPNPKFNINGEQIFEGTIIDVPMKDGSVVDQYTTWDKYGRCASHDRVDCYVDVSGL